MIIEKNGELTVQSALHHLNVVLKHFPENAGYLEIRTFPDKNQGSPGQYFLPVDATEEEILEAIDWCKKESLRGNGIFIGNNPRSTRSGSKESIKQYVSAFLDLDLEKLGVSQEEALSELAETFPIKPTLITRSGGGLHVVFFFQPTDDYTKWVALQRKLFELCKHIGADNAITTDSARVLRLTPFPNQKLEEPRTTSIISENSLDSLPTFNAMCDLLDVDFAVEKRERFELPKEIHEHGTVEYEGRNAVIYKEACRHRHFGYSEEEIFEVISTINESRCKPPLPSRDIERIARSASRYDPTHSLVGEQITNEQSFFTSFGEFRNLELPNIEPVIFGLRAGEIGMLQARPNIGKSTLKLNTAICAAIGKEFYPLIKEGEPKRVMYLDFENTAVFLQADLNKMAESLDEEENRLLNENLLVVVDFEIDEEPFDLSNPMHLEYLGARANSHGADLIIVDTLAAGFARLSNENDNSEMKRVVIRPMIDLAKEASAAVVIIHHIGKASENGGYSKLMRGRGASSLGAAVRLILDLDNMKEGDRVIPNSVILNCAKIKGKSFEDVVFKLNREKRWFEPTSIDNMPVLSILDHICSFLGNHGMTSSQIAEELSLRGVTISERTLQRRLNDGIKAGLIKRLAHNQYALVAKSAYSNSEDIEIPFELVETQQNVLEFPKRETVESEPKENAA